MASVCSKDIGQAAWGDISADPISLSTGLAVPGVLSPGPSNLTLLDLGTALPGYALPTLTDSEWDAFSLASLPATVQKLLWPSQQVTFGNSFACTTVPQQSSLAVM